MKNQGRNDSGKNIVLNKRGWMGVDGEFRSTPAYRFKTIIKC